MPVWIDQTGQIRRDDKSNSAFQNALHNLYGVVHQNNYAINSKRVLGLLIGANVGIFLAHQTEYLSEWTMYRHFMFSELNFRSGRWWTILTYSFSHMDLLHFLNNMSSLWSSGKIFGSFYGPYHTVCLYLLGALGSAVSHVLFHPNQPRFIIGASGATSALMAALAVVKPLSTVSVPFLRDIPIQLYTAFFILSEVAQIFTSPDSMIAHAGHFGGAAVGLAYGLFLKQMSRR